MSDAEDDLRREIAELKARVERLEAAAHTAAPPRPVQPAYTPPVQTAPPPDFTPVPMPEQRAADRATLEKKIGSQLFNRVGIVAVLVGVAWFLKLAIDNGWVGPAMRVLIGMAAGAGVALLAQRFRTKGYSTFAYSLQAVATGILYLSLWAAYSVFHLVPGSIAFAAMALVTAFNAWLCWRQNSEVLAFYAAVGGFLTPLLLSAHADHELVLFGYLLVLDLAVVVLLASRPWSRLLLAAFAGTTFYAAGWYASSYESDSFGLTVFFAIIFFLIFAFTPGVLLGRARIDDAAIRHPFEASLVLRVLPPLNALVAFCELFMLFSHSPYEDLRQWLPLPFLAFYAFLPRLHPNRAIRAGIMETALAGAFATIAIPMEAHGRWIAILWFVEFALLTRAATRRSEASAASPFGSAALLRWIASSALVLGVAGLLAPIDSWHPPVAGVLVFNTRFASWLVGVAASAFAMRLAMQKTTDPNLPLERQPWRDFAGVSGLAATAMLLIAVCMEIHAYWAAPGGVPSPFAEQFSYSAWFMLSGAALLALGFWQKSAFLRWQALVLLALSITKVFLFDTRQLAQGYRILSFLGLGALLLTVSFAYQKDWLSLRGNTPSRER